MSPAIITKSFKKCSIGNVLVGMGDEVLWADSDEEGNDMYDDTQTDTIDVQ